MVHLPSRLLLLAAALGFSAVNAMAAPDCDKPFPRLTAPAHGKISVAFVVTGMANVIDVAGAWEVFQDTMVPERGPAMSDQHPFRLFTVSNTKSPVQMTGGLTIVPDYTFDDAPPASLIVVGAQRGGPKLSAWLRSRHKAKATVMSVCTGAFKLAQAGLLDGRRATTHHDFYDAFSQQFPKVKLQKSRRFVRSDARIFTAGGLTSGIDLALHVVALYFGEDVAARTADYMEYKSTGWKTRSACPQ